MPMSKCLFCAHPHSKKIFLATLRCFSVQSSLTFFRKRARAGSSHTPSFSSSCSCFAAHFYQYTDRAACTGIFLTSLGHTNLMAILVSSLKINVCQCGHFIPRSRVSHITAPAGLSPVSTQDQKDKEPLPKLSQCWPRFGAFFTSFAFLLLSAFLHSHHVQTYDEPFALFLCFTFIFFFLCLPLLPLLFLPPFLISPLFHRVFEDTRVLSLAVFFKSPRVLTLAVSFGSTGVPSQAVSLKGLWVLSLAVFCFFSLCK